MEEMVKEEGPAPRPTTPVQPSMMYGQQDGASNSAEKAKKGLVKSPSKSLPTTGVSGTSVQNSDMGTAVLKAEPSTVVPISDLGVSVLNSHSHAPVLVDKLGTSVPGGESNMSVPIVKEESIKQEDNDNVSAVREMLQGRVSVKVEGEVKPRIADIELKQETKTELTPVLPTVGSVKEDTDVTMTGNATPAQSTTETVTVVTVSCGSKFTGNIPMSTPETDAASAPADTVSPPATDTMSAPATDTMSTLDTDTVSLDTDTVSAPATDTPGHPGATESDLPAEHTSQTNSEQVTMETSVVPMETSGDPSLMDIDSEDCSVGSAFADVVASVPDTDPSAVRDALPC